MDFHLYVRDGCQDTQLVPLLQAEAPGLLVTTSSQECHRAQRFLLYLGLHTWNDAKLKEEVIAALDREVPLLLVHEQRAAHHPVPFGAIIERTPPELLKRGIYASLAMPLYDGDEHQRLCLRMMLITDDGSGTATLQPAGRRRWSPAWPWPRRTIPIFNHAEMEEVHTPALKSLKSTQEIVASSKV